MVLSREAIEKMYEADLRRQVIIPLLEAMGYQGVFEWHGGAGELGKDVVGWKLNELGNRRNLAVVAKRGRISGTTGINPVQTQVVQAFNTPYEDPLSGEEQHIHECWVVASGRLGKEARSGIRAALKSKDRYVQILDGDDLWKRVQQHMLIDIGTALESISQRIESSESPYSIGVEIPGQGLPFAGIEMGGRRIVLSERYPGQLDIEPFTIQTLFEFPDTPEGNEKLKQLQTALTGGGSAEIPGQYFAIQFPDALENLTTALFGTKPSDAAMLHIHPRVSDKRVPVRIEITCDDGDHASLEYVEWKVVESNPEEMTFANYDQPISIRVVNSINLKENTTNITVSSVEGPVAAPLLLRLVRLQQCLSKPCTVDVELIDPGLPLWSFRNDEVRRPPVDSNYIAALKDLTAVQGRVGVPILIPEGELNPNDLEAIALLRSLLREKTLTETWTDLSFQQTRAQAAEHSGIFLKSDHTGKLRTEGDLELALFGSRIPLGKVIRVIEDAQLANKSKLQGWLEAGGPEDEVIELQLVPGTSNKATVTFLDWGDPHEETGND